MHRRATAILTASAALALAACDPLGARADAERARAELMAAEAATARAKADAVIEKLKAELEKSKQEAERAKAEAERAKAECASASASASAGADPTPEVTPTPSGSGGLTKDQIRTVVREHTAEIRSCYNKALLKDPKLAGKVVVKFTIAADGSVSESVSAQTDVNDALTACIVDSTKTWKFPPPGEQVTVTYPFVLRSN